MTSVIYFSDLHVDDYAAHADKVNRLEECLLVLDDVFKIAAKREAKTILFSGDLFNTPKFLYTTVLTSTINRLARLFIQYPDVTFYSITGNHDFAKKNLVDAPTVSAQAHLAEVFPGRFILLDNDMKAGEGAAIMGIPNYEFKEHFREKLKEAYYKAKALKADVPGIKVTLMIHQSPEGQTNQMVKYNTSPSDPLYEPFDMILCGDIHTSQRITPKFLLGGNPLHKTATDAGKEKGIWIMDLENPVETLEFKSRKGRYHEFVRASKADQVGDGDKVILIPDSSPKRILTEAQQVNITKFSADLSPEVLLTNFVEITHPEDKELLATGLSFLPK